jgi:hypothetical protein
MSATPRRRGRRARGATLALLAAVLLGAGNCSQWLAPERDVVFPTLRPEPAYEVLFPSYVELCSVSQYRSQTKGMGGIPGHAVMYLKGACKDEEAPYPRLRRCRREATELDDPEHGAGVSVNRWFRNVNWVAVPGKELFFDGLLDPGDRLTQEHFDATRREAIERGVYRGVEFHDYPTEAEKRSLEEFVTYHSLATDFALRFSRTVFCARLPVTTEMLEEIVDFLNDLNREYATGAAEYRWSGYHDNCVHTLRNALAAASVWEPKSINVIKLRQLFHLAIPANEFANLAQLGTTGPLDDFGAVFRKDAWRDALLEFGWLPTRHGALLKILPVHQQNDLFDTTFRKFLLEGPLRRGTTRRVRELFSDPHHVELEANLEHFREVYEKILAGRRQAETASALRGDRRRTVRRRYDRYIEAQLSDVIQKLERLRALGSAGTTESTASS